MATKRQKSTAFSFLANPARFERFAVFAFPVFGVLALICLGVGLYEALIASPPDYQQKDSVRIMYIHVPAAWLALFIYTSMGIGSLFYLIWKHTLADLYAKAVAPIGAVVTLICLVTGSIWGYPTWGTWWVWDARLTSVFILFFIYIGYILFRSSFDDEESGAFAGSILLIVGLINIPIIKFSVDWWNTLHQPASLSKFSASSIHPEMLSPLLWMAGFYFFFFGFLSIMRLRSEMMKQKIKAQTLKKLRA